MTWTELLQLVINGGPGVCQIAVTNACNARCRFCQFPEVPPGDRIMADPQRLSQGLAALKKANIHFVSFTGGEPLLYPGLLPALAQAQQLGMKTILCTNGVLLSPKLIRELARVGLDTIIISVDADTGARHDEHRGVPGLTSHIQAMLPLLREADLNPVASVTLSRLIDDLDSLMLHLKSLGFDRVTFSYPLTHLNSSYLGYAPHESVDFDSQELSRWFDRLKALKSRSPIAILNPRLSMSDLQRQLQGKASRFPCLAGYKYFFVDWHLQIFPCHYLAQTLGPLEEIHLINPVRNGCSACVIDCYRDPSVYQYLAVSVANTLSAWRQGEWLKGLGSLLHPYNFLSLSALLEGRHWLRD
ncbi:MAG: radical SAM protein [Thermodesulfobacteriota bacterium]